MSKAVGLGILAVGIVLLVLGLSAADSFASDVKEFFTGQPTDRAIWLMIGGIAAIVVGGVIAILPKRELAA